MTLRNLANFGPLTHEQGRSEVPGVSPQGQIEDRRRIDRLPLKFGNSPKGEPNIDPKIL